MATQILYLGSGCYWSKEYYLSRLAGVLSTRVGFAGGQLPHPTYQQVCSKQTGHAEVVEVVFDPQQLPLAVLLQHFFSLHDASHDRSENGGQYRSAIFFPEFATEEDLKTIQTAFRYLQQQDVPPTTELREQVSFYPAETRHQGYCERLERPPKASLGYPLGAWPKALSWLNS